MASRSGPRAAPHLAAGSQALYRVSVAANDLAPAPVPLRASEKIVLAEGPASEPGASQSGARQAAEVDAPVAKREPDPSMATTIADATTKAATGLIAGLIRSVLGGSQAGSFWRGLALAAAGGLGVAWLFPNPDEWAKVQAGLGNLELKTEALTKAQAQQEEKQTKLDERVDELGTQVNRSAAIQHESDFATVTTMRVVLDRLDQIGDQLQIPREQRAELPADVEAYARRVEQEHERRQQLARELEAAKIQEQLDRGSLPGK